MKFFSTLSTLAVALMMTGEAVAGTYKGFSMGANRADGVCKWEADWKKDFQAIKSWNKGFNLFVCTLPLTATVSVSHSQQ